MPKNNVAPLLQSANARTEEVCAAIENAMEVIAQEIDEAGGVYPYNGGRLSQREVCKRARIHHMTLLSPIHKETTRKDVIRWIKRVTGAIATGRRTVRRAVNERAELWKEAHHKLATARHIDTLEVVRLKSALAEASEKISALEAKYAALLRQAGKPLAVVPIRATRKR